jgi:hypothetical protein
MLSDSALMGVNFVQNAKKEWTKRFVQDKKIAESFDSYVDAQTEFVKQSVKAWETLSVAASKELGKFPKFDLAK